MSSPSSFPDDCLIRLFNSSFFYSNLYVRWFSPFVCKESVSMPYERISTFGGKLACRSFQIDLFLCKNALLSLVYSLTHSLAHINRAICLTSRVNFFRSVPLFPSPFCFVRFSMSDIQTSVWCTLFSVYFFVVVHICHYHLWFWSIINFAFRNTVAIYFTVYSTLFFFFPFLVSFFLF